MAPFGFNRTPQPTEAEAQAAEVDLERIRQGGIPLGAEQRLMRLADESEPFFTSDLSAKEYAIAEADGLQPIAQVMGSSVVKHGWNSQGNLYYGGEVTALSQPWNMARERAFGRLAEEARLAGADGVVGIELSHSQVGDPGNAELVVFGTAVRDRIFPERREHGLGLCTLSAQEVDRLRRIGAVPCGVVGYTTVICVPLSYSSNWVMNSSGMFGAAGSRNMEIVEISQGVYDARNRAMHHVRQQATEARANEIVISTLAHTIEHREYENAGVGGGRQHYFYITMNILGTAIRLGAHPPYPAPFDGPLMSINLGR